MTVLPELEHALRDAAARRARARTRPHRPKLLEVLLPLALAAGAVALVLALVAPGPDPETPAATPTATPPASGTLGTLALTYGVFERPRTARDRLPKRYDRELARGLPGVRIDVEYGQSRLVATSGGYRAWAVPALQDGRPALCTVVDIGGGGSAGCGRFDEGTAAERPPSSRTTIRPGSLYFVMLPDGVRQVELELRDGRSVRRPVRDNGVLIAPRTGARSASWTVGRGSPFVISFDDDPRDETD